MTPMAPPDPSGPFTPPPGLISVAELPKWVPGEIRSASDSLGWKDVAQRTYGYQGQDVEIPPLACFLIVHYRQGATPMDRQFDGRWTQGPEARLAWRLPPAPGEVTLRLRGWIIRPARGPAPQVELWCGGTRLTTMTAPPKGQRPDFETTVAIPARRLQGQTALVLTFVVHDPVTPLDGGLSGDIRPLGYCLQSVLPVTA